MPGTQGMPGPFVGATIDVNCWTANFGTVTYAQAISGQPYSFDTYVSADGVSRPMAASVQKSYRQLGSHPASIKANEQGVISAGGKLLMCWKPQYGLSGGALTAEQNALQNDVQMIINAYIAAGWSPAAAELAFDSILWQEITNYNSGEQAAFPHGASDYITYANQFNPVITALGGRVVMDFGGGKPQNWTLAWVPSQVTAWLVDYYGSDYHDGTRLDGTGTGSHASDPNLIAMAATAGVTLGIGEWGNQAVLATPLTVFQWNNYKNYLQNTLQPLAFTGMLGDVVLYMGSNAPSIPPLLLDELGGNCLSAGGYDPVTNIQHVYDHLTVQPYVAPAAIPPVSLVRAAAW